MTRATSMPVCRGYGRIARFGNPSTRVDVGTSSWLTVQGPLGADSISTEANDLLKIAAAVYRSERQLPRRAASNPYVRYTLTVPVSNPGLWRGKPTELLQDLLGFLGSCTWEIEFVPCSRRTHPVSAEVQLSTRRVDRIALFSGGLDSTSGVGSGALAASHTQLCSFYTRQKALQADLAAKLGFDPPTQWRLQSSAGPGRSFFYRSFFFLALAAATAETWKAREIIQFENGILASAIPPVPSLLMTKHAHPRTQSLFAQVLGRTLGGDWRVINPMWQKTKREAVELLNRHVGSQRAASVIALTQSCWNLSAPRVFGVREVGRFHKRVNQQCGICVPCIIRHVALPTETYAFDLKQSAIRNHAKLSIHFLEYLEFLSDVRRTRSAAELRTILPAEALELIDDGWTDLAAIERLLRGFADEFFETFEIQAA